MSEELTETEVEDEYEEDEPRERASLIVISDFVCPWCYIGLSEVERLKDEYDFDIHYAPFLLRPDTPPEGAPVRYFTPPEAPATPVEKRGETLGLEFRRGREVTNNSHLSLEAAEFAHEYAPDSFEFHKRMFKAYFTDLEDISDIDVLVRVGEESGLDSAALRQALEERRYKDLVDEGLSWSKAIGVTAVPTFVFNEQFGMVGAQELPAFRQMMEKIGQPRKIS